MRHETIEEQIVRRGFATRALAPEECEELELASYTVKDVQRTQTSSEGKRICKIRRTKIKQ